MKIFVIMPFAHEFTDIYNNLIKPAFVSEGLVVNRADDLGHNQHSIMRDVVHGITEADLIVAELTTKNANVLYELGIAHGLRKSTVMIAQNFEDVPSDLRSYRFIQYSTHFIEIDRLRNELRGIAVELKEGRFLSANPVTDFGHPATHLLANADISVTQQSLDTLEDQTEKGLWDFVVSGQNAFSQIAKSAQIWTDLAIKFQGEIVGNTAEINALRSTNLPGNASRIQKVINLMARGTNNFGKGIQAEIATFHQAWEEANSNISGLLSITKIKTSEDKVATENFLGIVTTLRDTMKGTYLNIEPTKSAIGQWRGLGRDLNNAVDLTEEIFNQLLLELAIGESYCDRFINLLDSLLTDFESNN